MKWIKIAFRPINVPLSLYRMCTTLDSWTFQNSVQSPIVPQSEPQIRIYQFEPVESSGAGDKRKKKKHSINESEKSST